MSNILKILFIEKDADYFRYIQKLLSETDNFKFNLIQSESFFEANEITKKHKIDVILVDYNLTYSQIHEVFNELNLENPEIPIIMLSKAIDEKNALLVLPIGVYFYSSKDLVNGHELSSIISYVIRLKQAESKLFEYMSIVKNADVAIYSKNMDLTIRTWNFAAEKLYGYTADEMIGKSISILFPDEVTKQEQIDIVESAKSGKLILQYPTKRLKKDGTVIDVLLSTSPILDSSGNIFSIAISSQDITERVNLEKELSVLYHVTKTFNQSSNIADAGSSIIKLVCETLEWQIGEFWLVDSSGNTLQYVSGWSESGYSEMENISKNTIYHIYEGLHGYIWNTKKIYWTNGLENDRLITHKDTLDRLQLKGIFGIPIIYQQKLLGITIYYAKNIPMPDNHFFSVAMILAEQLAIFINRVYIKIHTDILTQKLKTRSSELDQSNRLLQEALSLAEKSDKAKSAFLANMSHELRSPLNAIIGFTELIHNGKVGPVSPQHKDYLYEVLTSSHHLLLLINQILDISRIEAGKIELNPEKISINQLISEVVNDFRIPIEEKQIHYELHVDPKIDYLIIDPLRFKQALYNYLSNAIKFSNNQGHISISVSPESMRDFRLEVSDTGIGIKDTDIEKLFVPFEQLDAGQSKKYQGSGLGLALTKKLVEAQGGKVGVMSVFGRGSTFYFILPRIVR